MPKSKQVVEIRSAPPMHWVGDGFPVSSIFSPSAVGNQLSPFILMDYASPTQFTPAAHPRGVDSHPHRGFETVTIVFQGELEHRDSAGNHGSIGPGDVQWMTAAAGVLHEEKHSAAFTQDGGMFEVAQLWVNLPAKRKMDSPRYQDLPKDAMPTVTLPDSSGSVRVIAGSFNRTPGAAKTVTPVLLWDMTLSKGGSVDLPIDEGFNAAIFVRSGEVRIGADKQASRSELAILSQQGANVNVTAELDARLLVVGGQPIDEPVVAYGPFVMNRPEEIRQAMEDVRSGKFGQL